MQTNKNIGLKIRWLDSITRGRLVRAALLPVAVVIVAIGSAVDAKIMVVTYKGTLSYGVDLTGIFGAPGQMAGDPFNVSFTYDTLLGNRITIAPFDDLSDTGTAFGTVSAIIDVKLKINSVTEEFDGSYDGFTGTENASIYGFVESGGHTYRSTPAGAVNDSVIVGITLTGAAPSRLEDSFSGSYFSQDGYSPFRIETGSEGFASLSEYAYGNLFATSVTVAPFGAVPEPEAWMLLMLGFGVVGVKSRRHGTNAPAERDRFGNNRSRLFARGLSSG